VKHLLWIEVRERGALVILDRERNDPDAYLAANQAIIDDALRAANKGARAPRLVAVIVWEGATRGGDDTTDDFRRAALQRGFAINNVPTIP
jgi:hypothetical protein